MKKKIKILGKKPHQVRIGAIFMKPSVIKQIANFHLYMKLLPTPHNVKVVKSCTAPKTVCALEYLLTI